MVYNLNVNSRFYVLSITGFYILIKRRDSFSLLNYVAIKILINEALFRNRDY